MHAFNQSFNQCMQPIDSACIICMQPIDSACIIYAANRQCMFPLDGVGGGRRELEGVGRRRGLEEDGGVWRDVGGGRRGLKGREGLE